MRSNAFEGSRGVCCIYAVLIKNHVPVFEISKSGFYLKLPFLPYCATLFEDMLFEAVKQMMRPTVAADTLQSNHHRVLDVAESKVQR